jgi:hypothetical protein
VSVAILRSPDGPVYFPTLEEEARGRACGRLQARRYESGEVPERAYIPGDDREANSSIGAIGELLFSERYLEQPWFCDLTKYGDPDVLGYHVRTRRSWNPQLQVQQKDPDDGLYVLLWTTAPRGLVLGKYKLAGWATGARVRRDGILADPGGIGAPAYWLDTWLLDPIATLPVTLELERARRIARRLAEDPEERPAD